MKIVINSCYGGFGLSQKAIEMYCAEKDIKDIHSMDIPRDDDVLIRIVETLGGKANGNYSKLKIVEIPDDVEWQIKEYDGNEWIAELHRTWE